MARISDRLFIGVGGHIVALDAATGEEIWRTHLKGSDVVTVTVTGNRVLGSTKGEIYCVDPSTGGMLWHNRLKGLGTGIVAFASSGAEIAGAVKALDAARAAAAAG